MRPAIIAVCGITASVYLLQPIFSPCSPPYAAVLALACFFIMVLTLLNLLSTRASIIWQNIAFYAKIFALFFVISLGIYQLVRGHHEVFASPFANTQTSIKKLSIACYIGLFPYSGWNYLSNAIEELKNPARNFPIAIMFSIIASTILYALAYSAYFTALTPNDVMKVDAVAVTFAENVYRPFGYIMPLFVSISALGGLNGRMKIKIEAIKPIFFLFLIVEIFSIVRMFSVAGRDGLLPSISSYLHIKRFTPVIPCIVEGILGTVNLIILKIILFNEFFFYTLGILYVLVGNAERLLAYLSFSTWLICLCGAASVLVFRRTMPDTPRPFNAGTVAPVVFIVAMGVLTLVNVIFNPFDILVGILILLSGLPVYWIFVLNRPASVDKFSRLITIYLQKALLVVPDDTKQHD